MNKVYYAIKQILRSIGDDWRRWQSNANLKPGFSGYDRHMADVERRHRGYQRAWQAVRDNQRLQRTPAFRTVDALIRHGNPTRDPAGYAEALMDVLNEVAVQYGEGMRKSVVRRAQHMGIRKR